MMPTAFGYLRLEDGESEEDVNRLHDVLSDHAEREGLALAEVFVDRNMCSDQVIGPGLTVLLEAVRRDGRAVVLLSKWEHLAASASARHAITAVVVNLGGRIQAVEPISEPTP
ncbi:hypothetical protein [Parafrankia elaeagni]|uniref:hypothetical protein n=1 Tax=Parafrankia elaeagni TaxID=222534 RepID=UPI000376E3D9|nr:hypothetical protein [Parafrankia elaeagni]